MSVTTCPVPGQEMSWAQYERLVGDPLAEHIDGRLVMSSSPTYQHQLVPDVMVFPAPTETTRCTGTPELVIEVLSTNGSDDLVLEVGTYARAGLERCWVVDPRDGVLDAFVLGSGIYRHVAHVTADDAPAVLDLGVAAVRVDVAALLRL